MKHIKACAVYVRYVCVIVRHSSLGRTPNNIWSTLNEHASPPTQNRLMACIDKPSTLMYKHRHVNTSAASILSQLLLVWMAVCPNCQTPTSIVMRRSNECQQTFSSVRVAVITQRKQWEKVSYARLEIVSKTWWQKGESGGKAKDSASLPVTPKFHHPAL